VYYLVNKVFDEAKLLVILTGVSLLFVKTLLLCQQYGSNLFNFQQCQFFMLLIIQKLNQHLSRNF